MAEIVLSPKERQALKARAHGLDPVVLLGAQGLTEAVVREIDRALNAHELIKVRVPVDDRDERERIFVSVAGDLGAARVQMIGKLLVLYRPRAEEPEEAPAPSRSGRSASGRSRKERSPLERSSSARRSQHAARGAPRKAALKRPARRR
jgi:RNA-binding protein